jgi:hypothetical protein
MELKIDMEAPPERWGKMRITRIVPILRGERLERLCRWRLALGEPLGPSFSWALGLIFKEPERTGAGGGLFRPLPTSLDAVSWMSTEKMPQATHLHHFGAVGQVVVSGAKGNEVLTRSGPMDGTDGSAVQATLQAEQLATQFGEAKAAQPLRPEHFMPYFVSGGARLTPASELKFAKFLNRWRAREKQPLFPTPGGVPEPRNRRVQVTSAECPLAHRPTR